MDFKNWRKWAFVYIMVACIQYVILSAIAMLFYGGGTLINPLSPGYSFFGNFFSDLGRTVALSGTPNTTSFIIFTISAITMSVSLIPFSIAMPNFFKQDKMEYKVSVFASFVGILAGIFLITTVLTPWDIFHNVHLTVGNFYSLSGLAVITLFSFVMIRNKKYNNIYALAFIVLAVIAFIYSIIVLVGPEFTTLEGLIIQVTMQKIVQYSFLTCFFIQGYGAWKNLQKE